jgi:hypothetical protein
MASRVNAQTFLACLFDELVSFLHQFSCGTETALTFFHHAQVAT